MAKVMMAWPETKLSPARMHPAQDRVRDCGPRPLPLDQPLDQPLGGELAGHHQHQRGGQPPAPHRQRPDGHDQRHAEHAQILEDKHGLVQPLGQPVDGVEGGPLDRPNPSIGGHHRTDGEHRQAGHQHHDVASNTAHDLSPPPAMPSSGRPSASGDRLTRRGRVSAGRVGEHTTTAVVPDDTMSPESILIGRLAGGSCAFVK
jgi:hypothetical protein